MNQETTIEDNLFLQQLKPDEIGCVGQTWVFPGTVLYNKCKKLGLIDDDFWFGQEPYYIVPAGMEW